MSYEPYTPSKNKIKVELNLSKKADCDTRIGDTGKKILDHDHDEYITTQEFNKLMAGNFAARLKQENLASKDYIADLVKKQKTKNKTDYDDKLI